ncbi:MAG: DUF4845 domain-containing protein [Methylococcaceae bacterium]|nr:DUF4845 domain-containing protein [Methylococcaceae bacterium]
MKVSPKHQQGLTFISIASILGLIGFFTLLILKIVPIYIDHNKVSSALNELRNSPEALNLSEPEIRSSLNKRFNINYVYDVNQDDITVVKHGDYLKVTIEYEVAKKVAGNLSILAEFNDVIEIGQP